MAATRRIGIRTIAFSDEEKRRELGAAAHIRRRRFRVSLMRSAILTDRTSGPDSRVHDFTWNWRGARCQSAFRIAPGSFLPFIERHSS